MGEEAACLLGLGCSSKQVGDEGDLPSDVPCTVFRLWQGDEYFTSKTNE
jgi:hypothetical protein